MQSKIVIRCERCACARIRFAARHDDEWNFPPEALRSRLDHRGIMCKVARRLGDLHGNIKLDAMVTQALAQAAGNEHYGCLTKTA